MQRAQIELAGGAGVDEDSGLIHSVVVTPANVNDLTRLRQPSYCMVMRQWFKAMPIARTSFGHNSTRS